jgi:hypothetical protein
VIVRILGEGQYQLPDDARKKLESLDSKVADAVDAGDEAQFRTALTSLTAEVRRLGAPVPHDTFAASDLVVPFPDATLAETKGLLAESADGSRADEH